MNEAKLELTLLACLFSHAFYHYKMKNTYLQNFISILKFSIYVNYIISTCK